MTEQVTANRLMVCRDGARVRVAPQARDDVRKAVISFLDAAITATGQATFYNTKKEQQDAIDAVHTAVFAINRGLYTAMLCLPGVTDDGIQRGVIRLLSERYDAQSLLTDDQEQRALTHLVDHFLSTAPQRLFKLFGMFKERRINNRRTRRLVLGSVLGAMRLPYWSVKYRMKLRTALTHAWGIKVASGVRKFVSDPLLAAADSATVVKGVCQRLPEARRYLLKYLPFPETPAHNSLPVILECLCFILGGERATWRVPVIKSFYEAHTDLGRGSLLPKEVLEGIRGKLFKDTPKGRVIEITKAQMTEGQKMASQAEAKRDGVALDFDPTKQDLIKLYVYALERRSEIDAEEKQRVRAALNQKAQRVAASFPLTYDKVAVVLDTSRSMYGTDQSKCRPMAIALAMNDILRATARTWAVTLTDGRLDDDGLLEPHGDTALAEQLLAAFETGADAVYVVTDGYENAPAGRFDEVLRLSRQCGVTTPVYQITPVMAAEKVGVRALSESIVPLPVSRPEALGLAMIRAALNNDIEAGILGLLNTAMPLLG